MKGWELEYVCLVLIVWLKGSTLPFLLEDQHMAEQNAFGGCRNKYGSTWDSPPYHPLLHKCLVYARVPYNILSLLQMVNIFIVKSSVT